MRSLNSIVAVCQNMGIGKDGTLPWPPLRYGGERRCGAMRWRGMGGGYGTTSPSVPRGAPPAGVGCGAARCALGVVVQVGGGKKARRVAGFPVGPGWGGPGGVPMGSRPRAAPHRQGRGQRSSSGHGAEPGPLPAPRLPHAPPALPRSHCQGQKRNLILNPCNPLPLLSSGTSTSTSSG